MSMTISRTKIKLITAESSLTNSRRIINENFKAIMDDITVLKDLTPMSKLIFPTRFSTGDTMVLEATKDGKFALVKNTIGIGTKYKFEGESIIIPKNHQYIVTKLELLNGSSVITEPGGELVVLDMEIKKILGMTPIPELSTKNTTIIGAINELAKGTTGNVKGSKFTT